MDILSVCNLIGLRLFIDWLVGMDFVEQSPQRVMLRSSELKEIPEKKQKKKPLKKKLRG